MNIETANRLYELRKKNGLSQEELADKLGISRQAVSKWERAEASPDTDNLILLAKLYGVTLDELLNSESAEDLAKENIEADPIMESEIVEEENNIKKDLPKKELTEEEKKEKNFVLDFVSGLFVFGTAIVYLTIGFLVPNYGWSCYWVLFLLIPIASSLVEAIQERRICKFLYPVLVVAVYCFLGMRFNDVSYNLFGKEMHGFWHPMWILFLTIPLFYAVAGPIDSYIHKTEDTNTD